MSYKGTEEFICKNGHYISFDSSLLCYGTDDPILNAAIDACPVCKAGYKHRCSVDRTNGYYADDPETFNGPKEEIGFDDEWNTDHYGNKFAVKVIKYKPIGKRWNKIK